MKRQHVKPDKMNQKAVAANVSLIWFASAKQRVIVPSMLSQYFNVNLICITKLFRTTMSRYFHVQNIYNNNDGKEKK